MVLVLHAVIYFSDLYIIIPLTTAQQTARPITCVNHLRHLCITSKPKPLITHRFAVSHQWRKCQLR